MRYHLKNLKEEQKRQATRMQRDALDRVLLDLLAFFRDLLAGQLGAEVGQISVGLDDMLRDRARKLDVHATLESIGHVERSRQLLQTNTKPLLIMEALLAALVPGR